MFKFNTTTIINSDKDFTSGVPLFSGQEETTSESGKIIPANFSVKRGLTFLKPYVKAVYVRRHNDPQLAQVKIDLSNITEAGIYRIAVYIRLQGSNNEYYANDFVFKGKPFFIEFTKKEGETGVLAEKVVKIAKKYMQMVYEYPLIKVSNEGNVVILDATDEYQRFTKVELQKYDETAGLHQSCCSNAGEFVTIDFLGNKNDVTFGQDSDNCELKGREGFGTYRNLIKNLRLPTKAHRAWEGIIQDETPVFGTTYDQYTIWYCRKVGIQGLDAVGDVVQSLTSHIFFVNTALKSAWEAALANIGDLVEVEDGVYTPTPDDIELEESSAASKASEDASNDITQLQSDLNALTTRVTALEG